MMSESRRPEFDIKITRPDWNAGDIESLKEKIVVEFTEGDSFTNLDYNKSGIRDNKLIGYEYSEGISNYEGSFSIELTAELSPNGVSIMDDLDRHDIVRIEEFGVVVFIGVIHDMAYSSMMTESGEPDRKIVINGYGLGWYISSIQLLLDLAVQSALTNDKIGVGTAGLEAEKFMAELARKFDEGSQLKSVLIAIRESFFDLVKKIGAGTDSTFGYRVFLDKYIDWESKLSEDVIIRYPGALSIYNKGINNIWSIWKEIAAEPLNELFGRFNPESGKYEVIFRQVPFNPEDWKALKIHKIDPLYLKSINLTRCKDEPYTFFMATINNLTNGNAGLIIPNYNSNAYVAKEQFKRYGYRPMIVDLKYFDQETGADSRDAILNGALKDISTDIGRWFDHNDDLYSGLLQMITTKNNYILAGDKVSFLGGEFYVEDVTKSWNLNAGMITRMSLTRGYEYQDGEGVGRIKDITRSVQIFEKSR